MHKAPPLQTLPGRALPDFTNQQAIKLQSVRYNFSALSQTFLGRLQVMEQMKDRKELHLTVTSDSSVGFDEMLELALKELRRYAKAAEKPGKINQGNVAGTVGSYTFEILRGAPTLCVLIRELEAEAFQRVNDHSGISCEFEHKDGRRKSISLYDMKVSDIEPYNLELIRPLLSYEDVMKGCIGRR